MASHLKQLPDKGEIFLDHVGWMIPDMQSASEAFLKLGFVLTPYSEHSNENAITGEITLQGSANRLIMLETGYLELLTDVTGMDTNVSQHLRTSMKRYIGVHLAAFSIADAEVEAERLLSVGFELQPTVNLRRTIEAADGAQAGVAFSVIRPKFGSIAEGRIQSLTHHTPEHMWQSRYIHHANALNSLTGIIFCTRDPETSAKRFSKYTNRPVHSSPLGYGITTDRGQLIFTDKETLAARFGGIRAPDLPSIAALIFTSSDFEVTREYMNTQKIELLEDQPDRLIVNPDHAMGTALIIENQRV